MVLNGMGWDDKVLCHTMSIEDRDVALYTIRYTNELSGGQTVIVVIERPQALKEGQECVFNRNAALVGDGPKCQIGKEEQREARAMMRRQSSLDDHTWASNGSCTYMDRRTKTTPKQDFQVHIVHFCGLENPVKSTGGRRDAYGLSLNASALCDTLALSFPSFFLNNQRFVLCSFYSRSERTMAGSDIPPATAAR